MNRNRQGMPVTGHRARRFRRRFDLRFQQATRQLANTHRFKQSRTKLAQLLTVQKERLSSTAS